MARIILIAIALMATLAETGSSVAAGAIAVGRPEDIAKRGISMGFSTNRETMDEAKTRSLKLCANSGSLISGVLCEVVATFENKCVAVAIDPAEQTPGFGWAVADTEQASKCRHRASRQGARLRVTRSPYFKQRPGRPARSIRYCRRVAAVSIS